MYRRIQKRDHKQADCGTTGACGLSSLLRAASGPFISLLMPSGCHSVYGHGICKGSPCVLLQLVSRELLPPRGIFSRLEPCSYDVPKFCCAGRLSAQGATLASGRGEREREKKKKEGRGRTISDLSRKLDIWERASLVVEVCLGVFSCQNICIRLLCPSYS